MQLKWMHATTKFNFFYFPALSEWLLCSHFPLTLLLFKLHGVTARQYKLQWNITNRAEQKHRNYCCSYFTTFNLETTRVGIWISAHGLWKMHYLNRKRQNYEIYGTLWEMKQRLCTMSYKYCKFNCCPNISNEFLVVFYSMFIYVCECKLFKVNLHPLCTQVSQMKTWKNVCM
jgi:hypothetical protein